MAALTVQEPPDFTHPAFELLDGDKLQRKADAPAIASRAEDEEEQRTVMAALLQYVTSTMVSVMGFQEIFIPEEDAPARCPIYCTADWNTAPRLLIVLINQVRALRIWCGRSRRLFRRLLLLASAARPSIHHSFNRSIDHTYATLTPIHRHTLPFPCHHP